MHTNQDAPRYRYFAVDPQKPGRDQWREIIAQEKDVLQDVAVIGETLVAEYMHDASSRLRLLDKNGKLMQEIALPTLGTVAGLGGAWDGDELFFGFQSFTVASSVYRVDLKTAKQELWGQVHTDIDSKAYTVEQVRYPIEGWHADHDVLGPQEGHCQ